MIIIKPDFYDDFKCIADKCSLSCCSDWIIDIDQETYKKYMNMEGELGKILKGALKKEEIYGKERIIMRLDENRNCPMLDDDGLCRIVLEKGGEYLSKVCKRFPRTSKIFGFALEKTLAISCPAVIEFLYDREHIELSVDLNGETSVRPFIEYEIRKALLGILQIKQFPLEERMFLVLKMLNEVKPHYLKCYDEKIIKVLTKYLNFDYLLSIVNKNKENNIHPKQRYDALFSIYGALSKKIRASEYISFKIDFTLKGMFEAEKKFKKEVYRKIEYVFENICVMDIFRRFSDKLEYGDYYLYTNTSIVFLKAILIKYYMFIFWLTHDENIKKEYQKQIISSVSRAFDSPTAFFNNFKETDKKIDVLRNHNTVYHLFK